MITGLGLAYTFQKQTTSLKPGYVFSTIAKMGDQPNISQILAALGE